MTSVDPQVSPTLQLLDYIIRGGAVASLLLVIVGGYYGLWYYGPAVRKREEEYKQTINDLIAEKNEWKKMSLDIMRSATRVVSALEESSGDAPTARKRG